MPTLGPASTALSARGILPSPHPNHEHEGSAHDHFALPSAGLFLYLAPAPPPQLPALHFHFAAAALHAWVFKPYLNFPIAKVLHTPWLSASFGLNLLSGANPHLGRSRSGLRAVSNMFNNPTPLDVFFVSAEAIFVVRVHFSYLETDADLTDEYASPRFLPPSEFLFS